MTKENVMQRISEIEVLARSMGLDFYPIIYDFVNKDIMLEACSYGLPIRVRHWSYGKSYQHSKVYGEMGLSRVYEIVFNNNPAYAFLMDNNTDIINIMVGAHVMGHVNFFKNNVMFKDSDKSMVYRAAERATRVDSYIEQYGMDKVEHLMDIGMALDRHIDWGKGLYRKKYPERSTIQQKNNISEFNDLSPKKHSRRLKEIVLNDTLPPHPEKDLLWFLINYGKLEDWEIDVLTILREEAFYFYPIIATKVLNEGFACVLKDTIMYTENGIITINDAINNGSKTVYDGENNQNIVHDGVFNNRDTIKIYTKRGLVLGGADNHRILDNKNEWKQLKDVSIGDSIKISGGNNLWSNSYKTVDYETKREVSCQNLCKKCGISSTTLWRNINQTHKTKDKNIAKINSILLEIKKQKESGFASCMGNRKEIIFPKTIDANLGSFVGYLIGDGHISYKARNLGLTSGDYELISDFSNLSKTLFGIDPKNKFDDSSKNGRWRSNIYSLEISDFLTKGLGMKSGICARIKEIPSLIMQSPKEVISAFLRSYFDCDGCASEKCGIILSTSSDKLVEQTQIILLNYGILSYRKKAKDECWQLRITGESAKIFYDQIGFGLERKQNKLKSYLTNRKWFCKERWEDKVVKIEHCGKQDVYDISVTNTHRYAAGGFINHNSFWHAELMYQYKGITEEEYIDFAKCHSGVINPGNMFNINPYYIGFKMLTNIREKWDKLHSEGKSEITGIQKVLQVAAEEDDYSFLRNYLTEELTEELGLFNYGYRMRRKHGMKKEDMKKEHGIIELKDRDIEKIIDNMMKHTVNYGAPLIHITEVNGDTLVMKHDDRIGPLDIKYTEKTLGYIYELWGGAVELETYGHDKEKIAYYFDESGLGVL